MKRTPIKRKSRMPRISASNWWEKLRRELKEAFSEAGIITCEIRYEGCWRNNALGFAHSLKRRHIVTEEQRREVILACNICHDRIEGKPDMADIVREIIGSRPTPVIFNQ